MTDTTAPAPTWLVVIQGLMPSLNQALVVVVTASVTFISTLALQHFTTPRMALPAADKPAPVSLQRQIDLAVNRLDGRITEVSGVCGLAVDEVQALRKDHKTPARSASPATKAAPAK